MRKIILISMLGLGLTGCRSIVDLQNSQASTNLAMAELTKQLRISDINREKEMNNFKTLLVDIKQDQKSSETKLLTNIEANSSNINSISNEIYERMNNMESKLNRLETKVSKINTNSVKRSIAPNSKIKSKKSSRTSYNKSAKAITTGTASTHYQNSYSTNVDKYPAKTMMQEYNTDNMNQGTNYKRNSGNLKIE